MLLESRNRPLVEAIDNAIEQAENLGLTFVASILMMARLEADLPALSDVLTRSYLSHLQASRHLAARRPEPEQP